MSIHSITAGPRSPRRPPAAPVPRETNRGDAATPPKSTPAERRHAMIADAAYFRAAARGFAPGHETEDWLGAERELEEV